MRRILSKLQEGEERQDDVLSAGFAAVILRPSHQVQSERTPT